MNMITRSIRLDVSCCSDKRQAVVNSIRKYRAGARKMFAGIAMAEIAGGTLDPINGKLTPDNTRSKNILSDAFDIHDKKAHAYEMRNFIRTEYAPEWMAFVWDSLRVDVSSKWRARDPEYKATRGWLIDQGSRNLGFFSHIGIGFPQAVRPKIEGHKIFLKWQYDLHEVEFVVGKLDPGRYYHFKNIRDRTEGYIPGTFFLNERDGKLSILLTYSAPAKVENLDPKISLDAYFNTQDPSSFISIEGSSVKVSALEVKAWIEELKILSDKFKFRMGASGNPRKSWGYKQGFQANSRRLNNVTVRRSNGEQYRNHAWARRIVDSMKRDHAGVCVVHGFPEKEMFGFPWNFSQLKSFIEYKVKEVGGKVLYV